MKKILITGGSGLIGHEVTKALKQKGHDISIVGRTRPNDQGIKSYIWNPEKKFIEEEALSDVQCIIHLAGADIASARWSEKRKSEIRDSRVRSAELLFECVQKSGVKPNVFISASGTGYYGAVSSDHIFTEEDKAGNDFLGVTCKLWEEQADQFAGSGIRVVKFRTAPVLCMKFLSRMLLPFQLGAGTAFGSGKQFFPWIHLDDLVRMYVRAVEDESLQGAYHAAAPEFVTNAQFTRALADVLHRPYFMPHIPSAIIKLVLGERAALLLEGSRVSSKKILNTGYTFDYENLRDALEDILQKKN